MMFFGNSRAAKAYLLQESISVAEAYYPIHSPSRTYTDLLAS
jgi:hypothetical protein